MSPGLEMNGNFKKNLQSKAQFSYRVLPQGWGQSSATPHTVGRLAAEYHDEHTESSPHSYKL